DVRPIAPEIYFAFRGRLVSPLVLTHGGVSPMPLLPQESSYISSAKLAFCPSLETYSHSLPASFKSYSISLIQQMSFIVNCRGPVSLKEIQSRMPVRAYANGTCNHERRRWHPLRTGLFVASIIGCSPNP